jgi:hypothetical protein
MILRFKVTPHDEMAFHKDAHRALNFYDFAVKFCVRDDKSLL